MDWRKKSLNGRTVLVVALCALMGFLLSGTTPAHGQVYVPAFPVGELVAAPNAHFAYAYGTPIYDVPGELLHVTRFHGRSAPLNLWTFYYEPGTRAWVVGRDYEGLFFMVVIEDTGQTVWMPRFELAGVSDSDLMILTVIWTSNAPIFREGDLILPEK